MLYRYIAKVSEQQPNGTRATRIGLAYPCRKSCLRRNHTLPAIGEIDAPRKRRVDLCHIILQGPA